MFVNFWKINLNIFKGTWEGYPQQKIEIFGYTSVWTLYFGKFKNLQNLSMCFKCFTRKYVVGGADCAPPPDPGSNRVNKFGLLDANFGKMADFYICFMKFSLIGICHMFNKSSY